MLLPSYALVTLDTLVYSLAVPHYPGIFHHHVSDISWLHMQSASNLCGVLAGFLTGWCSDWLGRKGLLLTVQFISVVCCLMLVVGAYIEDYHTYSVSLLAFAFIFRKLNRSFSLVSALVTDVSIGDEARSRNLSNLGMFDQLFVIVLIVYSGAIFGLGFSLGPAFGGLLSVYLDTYAVFSVGLLAALTNLAIIQFFIVESHSHNSKPIPLNSIWRALNHQVVVLYLFIHMLTCTGQACYIATIGMVARDRFQMSTAGFGNLVSFFGLSYSFALKLIVPKILSYTHERNLLHFGLLVTTLARGYLAICDDVMHLYLAHFFVSIGSASSNIAIYTAISKYGRINDLSGSFLGIADSIQRFSGVLSPLIVTVFPIYEGIYSGAVLSCLFYFAGFLVSLQLHSIQFSKET